MALRPTICARICRICRICRLWQSVHPGVCEVLCLVQSARLLCRPGELLGLFSAANLVLLVIAVFSWAGGILNRAAALVSITTGTPSAIFTMSG